ncbi:hypothetical protein [Sandarakinorhabdus sp. DWP1-3-1]|uniref:hypothetical protein n=1 Tax=Sandarakinorhabdus sp. DWP1-3-1 TaxID=2804627 RepID=UPI003CE75E15
MMVLLGCADDGEACQRVGTLPATYASVAACNAAMAQQLPQQNNVDWPVIAARCETAQPSVQVASR